MLLALKDILVFLFEAQWARGTGKVYLRVATQLRAMVSFIVGVMSTLCHKM